MKKILPVISLLLYFDSIFAEQNLHQYDNLIEYQTIKNSELPEFLKILLKEELSNSINSNFLSKALYFYSVNDFNNLLSILQKNLIMTSPESTIPEVVEKAIGLNLLGQVFLESNCVNEAKQVLLELERIKQFCVNTPNNHNPFRLFEFVKFSEIDIEKEKTLCKQELNFVTKEIYEIAREALNMQAGEAAHHLIEAGSHAFKSLDHYLEAKKMEKENKSSEGGGESNCFEGTTIPIDRY